MLERLLTPLTHTMVTTEDMLRTEALPTEQRECIQIIHQAAIEAFRWTRRVIRRYEAAGALALHRASHDWLTPSGNIISFCDYLLSGLAGDMQPDVHERIETIFYKTHDLRRQMTNLIDYAWLEAQAEAPFKSFSLQALLTPQMVPYRTPLKLHWYISEALPHVYSSKLLLHHTMVNLLVNAYQFTPGPHGEVIVEAQDLGHHIQLTVSDTGIGIPYTEQRHIFEPFRKVDPHAPGLGLGLTIARAFIELQGSRLRVDSQPAAGSTFTFTVPLATNKGFM
jgi:signal transduction histidine kinase